MSANCEQIWICAHSTDTSVHTNQYYEHFYCSQYCIVIYTAESNNYACEEKRLIERTHVVKQHATDAPVRKNAVSALVHAKCFSSHNGYLSRTKWAEPAMAVVSLNVIRYMLPDKSGNMECLNKFLVNLAPPFNPESAPDLRLT